MILLLTPETSVSLNLQTFPVIPQNKICTFDTMLSVKSCSLIFISFEKIIRHEKNNDFSIGGFIHLFDFVCTT